MTDLGDLLGLPAPRIRHRAQTRCADPSCGLPVYVDRLVFGFGECCAEKRGLIVHRYRIAARPQAGETLLDHLPEEPAVEPFPHDTDSPAAAEIVLRRVDGSPDAAAVNACLIAWCRANDLPVGKMRENDPIVVDPHTRQIRYQLVSATGMYGFRTEPETTVLKVEPAGLLTGGTVCGHLFRVAGHIIACTLQVDPRTGRHPDRHSEPSTGITWTNAHPSPRRPGKAPGRSA